MIMVAVKDLNINASISHAACQLAQLPMDRLLQALDNNITHFKNFQSCCFKCSSSGVTGSTKHNLHIDSANIEKTISCVDTTGISEPKIPNLNLECFLSLPRADLKRYISMMKGSMDHIKFAHYSTPDPTYKAYLIVEEDYEKTKITMRPIAIGLHAITQKDKEGNKNSRVPDPGLRESMYPTDYLWDLLKGGMNSPEKLFAGKNAYLTDLTLNFGQDYPIKITSAAKNIRFEYLLAPRIERD